MYDEKGFLVVLSGSGINTFDGKFKLILFAAVIYRLYSYLLKLCEYFKLNLLKSKYSCILLPSCASFTCTESGFHWHLADALPAPSININCTIFYKLRFSVLYLQRQP